MSYTKLMRYCLFLLIILFPFAGLFAQKSIEKLATDKDVVNYVKYFFSEDETENWNAFQLVNRDEWQSLYNISKLQSDSLKNDNKNLRWVTVDLNRDGKLDLVVNGYLPEAKGSVQYLLLLFLSNTSDMYSATNLVNSDLADYPIYFRLTNVSQGRIPALILTQWAPNINKVNNVHLPYTIDTIALADKYVVNYNLHPDSLVIKQVTFEASSMDGNMVKVTMTGLDSAAIAPFHTTFYSQYGKDSVNIRGKISDEIYTQLLAFINYAGFKELPDHFLSNDGNAEKQHRLEVVYADGSRKKLWDESSMATYTIDAIYDWMDWLIDYTRNSYNIRRAEQRKNNN